MGSLSNDMQKTISNVGTTLSKSLEDGMENGGNLVDSMSGSMVGLGTTSTTVQDAVTSNSVTSEYLITQENQIGWIALYVVTIVIAVLGNLLFIVGCACTTRTRTTGYYLLINLSIRDILLASLCIPFTLNSEIIAASWFSAANVLGSHYCFVYRYCYYCFLFMLPLTLLFLSYHLFVENCKWNFAGEEGAVPRPWAHTIYLPMIWFFSLLFAAPTAYWWTEVRPKQDDFYKSNLQLGDDGVLKSGISGSATSCMQTDDPSYNTGSNMFFIISNLVTFCIPVILLFIPWWALLVQVCGCCTRKLRSSRSEFWLSIITLFMILFFEFSRAPFEFFNFYTILADKDNGWNVNGEPITVDFLKNLIPLGESYKAVMKWAVYAPALLHPLLYFTFSPEARHGVYILFTRMCSCCCRGSGADIEVASDDEKGQMLANPDDQHHMHGHDGMDASNVPLQSKHEEEM